MGKTFLSLWKACLSFRAFYKPFSNKAILMGKSNPSILGVPYVQTHLSPLRWAMGLDFNKSATPPASPCPCPSPPLDLSPALEAAGHSWTRTLSQAPDAAGHAWTPTHARESARQNDVSDRTPERLPDRMSETISDRMPKRMSESMSK